MSSSLDNGRRSPRKPPALVARLLGGKQPRAEEASFEKLELARPYERALRSRQDAAYRADVVFRRWDVRLADFRVDERLLDAEPLFWPVVC